MIKTIIDKNKLTMEEFRTELFDRLQKYIIEADQIFKGNNPSFQSDYEKLQAIKGITDRFCGASDILNSVLGLEVRMDDGMLYTQKLYNQLFYMNQYFEIEIRKEVGDPLNHEIRQACENLGLKGYKGYELFTFRRVRVFVNDKLVGIYDLDKHTFVD
ncbi:hypothetical protein SDC9_136874 [bioreactor metagenome]|uniref:Uncharacterized protein n=1 Tax=bioreactor metagenome TaxID=1076179 RepID=A0A645DMK2_9ZZZZ|nr:hypothetical protein [Oscillospiraceae bacterium]